jgi:hypothetical protein
MGRIASYDVWQVYDHETLDDNDLLSFAKSLFEEGFIKVSTVYDKNTDTIKTRYDLTAIKEEKSCPKEPDVKTLDTTDSKQESFLGRLFKKDEKKID